MNGRPGLVRMLNAVVRLDAAASAAMPALVLAAVPLLAAPDAPAGLVVLVVLGYAVFLGTAGALMAGLLVLSVMRGEGDVGSGVWPRL